MSFSASASLPKELLLSVLAERIEDSSHTSLREDGFHHSTSRECRDGSRGARTDRNEQEVSPPLSNDLDGLLRATADYHETEFA